MKFDLGECRNIFCVHLIISLCSFATAKALLGVCMPAIIVFNVNPRRHRGGGLMQLPCGFSGISFCLPVEWYHFFYSFPPIFLRPPWKFQDPDPPNIWLWRHSWGHLRRKMRSVAHNLQTSLFFLVVWMWAWSTKYIVLMHSTGHPVLLQVNRGQLRSNGQIIGDHGFSSLFGTWPDLRGHWLT